MILIPDMKVTRIQMNSQVNFAIAFQVIFLEWLLQIKLTKVM